MKIKRFFAPNIRAALEEVRRSLGPDAVILSNHGVEGGVELVAAIDYSEALLSRQIPPARPAAAAASKDASRIEWMQEPVLVDMRRELNSLRGLLEQQLSGLAWGELARRRPLQMRVIQGLRALNLDAPLCREIAADVDEAVDFARAWRRALAVLAHRIEASPDDLLERGGLVAIVGPTGVGKTTTIAKLAARFVLRHGAHNLALVSTDRDRIGAQDELRAYGRILGVPTTIAATPAEMRAALGAFAGRRLVLIDTAGFGQKDARVGAQLELLGAASAPIRSYLVLSAATQRAGLDQTLRAFAPLRPAGCVVSKLDEAASLGELLSVLVRERLPAAYLSDGQRIPEDLRPARPHHLVSAAVVAAQRISNSSNGKEARNALHA